MSFNLDFRAQIEGDSEIQRKIDDFVKALEDLQKAGDDVERPLSDAAKAMDDLAKSAGGVGKDISDAEQALADISKSAGDADKALVDADKSFNDVSSSAADVTGELQEADAAFSDIANDADASVSSLDAVNSSFDNVSSAAQEAETNISAAATGIEGIGTSTDQATSALEGMGSAFEGAGTATTTFNDVLSSTGTAAQTAAGGLEQANTLVGEFGASADSARGSTEGLTGSVAGTVGGFTAMGSIVTSTVSTLFRMEDAQNRLDKANLGVARSTETARKAQLDFDSTLATASSNASGIADARGRLAEALERLNQLEEAGVRSGQAYQAAQEEVKAATAALRQEFSAGGGDLEKFDAGINRLTNSLDAVAVKMATAEKAERNLNITMLELPIQIAGLGGSIVQAVASADKFKDALVGVKAAITAISFTSIATSITAVLLPALAAAYAGFAVLESVPALTRSVNAAVAKDTQGMVQNLSEFLGVLERFASILPGLGGAPLKLAREALQEFAKSQGVATKEVDGSIQSLLNAEEHQKNLSEATAILTGKTTELGTSQQTSADATEKQKVAIEGIKTEIESARAGIEGYIAGIQQQVDASGTLESSLRQQNEAMAENISQTMDLVGSSENATNAIRNLQQSYADHQVAIDQLNTTLGTAEGQMLSYQNAVAAGDEAFLQWVQNTRDAAVEAETFKANLVGLAGELGNFPSYMEGTVEEYQAFIRANQEGGEAAEEFARMALESWRSLVSEAEPLFNDLKAAWSDIFTGETFTQAEDAIAKANEQIRQNVADNAAEMQKAQQQIADNMAKQNEQVSDNAQKMYDDIAKASEDSGDKQIGATKNVTYETVSLYEGVAPKIKDVFEGVDWESIAVAMADPFQAAFLKLPEMVSATLDQTEREALIFQAKFAEVAENAGTVFATNLQANMGQGFDQALASANQAVADMLAPFLTEHPEMAGMFQPLFDAMNEMGPGSAQGVQDALQELSGMPGPVGEIAGRMLQNYQDEFGGKLPGVTKTGVEGAIQQLEISLVSMLSIMGNQISDSMTEGFAKVIDSLNEMINKDIKQDPANVPLITANVNPANTQIQSIAKSVVDLKTFLAEPAQLITLHSSNINPLDGQVQLAGKAVTDLKTLLTSEESQITLVASNTNPLAGQITLVTTSVAQVNENLTTNTITLVGANTNPLAGQITLVTQAPELVNQFLAESTITMVGANTNPLVGQINLVVAAPEQVNQNLTQNTITLVAANTNPLAGQITLVTQAPGQVNQNLQQNPITMVGANINPVEGQVQLAVQAHQQLQTYFNQNPITMSVQQPQGYGTGMNPGGFNPGYVSPYGSYQGAYGPPNMGYYPQAKGFGPEIVDRPTRMLVGEAGPEMVSVIPMKGKAKWRALQSKTAAAGFGGMSYWSGGPYGPIGDDPNWSPQQMQQGAEHGTMQGAQQGTEQGMQQSQGGMQDAVQQGAYQGSQQGYQEVASRIQQALQQGNMAEAMAGFGTGYGFTWTGGAMGQGLGMGGGGGAGQYPQAPSNTHMWGAGRQTWTGGAMGTQLGGGGMGGGAGHYPTVGVPLTAQHAIGFGSRPIKYTWGGGASGTSLTPHGPFVGQGLPGPDPHAFGGSGGGGNPFAPGGPLSQPGGGVPEGWTDTGQRIGTTMGDSAATGFARELDANRLGTQIGQAAGRGLGSSITVTGGLKPDQSGGMDGSGGGPQAFPGVYSGQVPASYGPPLGQSINGIRATILPGQGPRGPRQAAFGMHERLKRDTLIQAHKNERVDISPGPQSQSGNSGLMDQRAMMRITQLLERLVSQGSNFKVDFNVDGRKLSSVAAKNMGTEGYGDK